MSYVGSGLVKLAYRGTAGFFVLLLTFTLGVTGTALSLTGGFVAAFSWVPIAFPELLSSFNGAVIIGNSVVDPGLASLVLLLVGLILLAVGFLLLSIAYFIGKGAFIADKELSRFVDQAFGVGAGYNHISQLERLAVLREQGVLTEEEFENEKAFVLNNHVPEEHSLKVNDRVQFVKR